MLTGRPYTAALLFPVLRAGRLSVGRPAGRMRLTNGNHADHTRDTTMNANLKWPLRAFLDLSTVHLSADTRKWLEGMDWANEGPSGGPTSYGWFLYCHDYEGNGPVNDEAWPEDIPADLRNVMRVARRAFGADYILFDRDAEAFDGELTDGMSLPVFEDA